MKALESFDTFLTALCWAGGIFYLWRYFAFVGYDLEDFRPASTASVVWNILLAVGFPLLGLLHRFSDKTNKTLVAIGMSTILVPAILPELAPPKTTSTPEWIYFRTIGKGIVDFVESSVITFLLFICWRFGSLWVAAYAGIAIFFGMARASWLLGQGVSDRTRSAPPLRRMFMIFAAAFGWVTVLSILFPHAESNSTMDLFPSQSPPNAPAHEIDLQVTLFRKSTVHVVGHADDCGPNSLRNLLAWIRFPTGSLSGNSRAANDRLRITSLSYPV